MHRTEPGMATRTGLMAREAMSPASTGGSRTGLRARTGLSTGSTGTVGRGKIGGGSEEVATSTTATTAREATTTMTSVEPGPTGKEIKRIMTSQISAPGKEAEALEEGMPRRSGSRTRRRKPPARDVAAATEVQTSMLAGRRSRKPLPATEQ